MLNPYLPKEAKIKKIIKETVDIKTYWISFKNNKDQEDFWHEAGQFVMIGLPSVGEAPISISSSAHLRAHIELTIRKTGEVTEALDRCKEGATVFIRGPYGRGWPQPSIDDHLVLIAGGIGLPAVKPLIDDFCHGYLDVKNVQFFYGTTHFERLVCVRFYMLWKKYTEVHMTLDHYHPKWQEHTGLITEIIKKAEIPKEAKAFIVGPPVMYKFVIAELKNKGLNDRNIFVSLERRMHCGIGVCQHCAVGSRYVCKNGPVFRWDKIKDTPFII